MSTALVLSGGGARASYQVGVLKAVSEILSRPAHNPFPVICGTSAGAINAALLACESDDFAGGVDKLGAIWTGLSSADVHEIGSGAIISSLYGLVRSMFNEGHGDDRPWSLFNNAPLRELLSRVIRFDRLAERVSDGDVRALAITALGYTTGASLTFFQAGESKGWHRHRRIGLPTELTLDHLMASTAIPGIYPAVLIHREYFGDGAVRQPAPLSPGLHLGATRLFVIGVSHNPSEPDNRREKTTHSPSLAQMTTHFLNGSFIDAMEEDIESLTRLNRILDYLPPAARSELMLQKLDVMSITPSKRFDECAISHIHSLPRSMRFLFRMLGATSAGGGASLAAYLMFEAAFINELIDCGYQDAMAQRQEIATFLGHDLARLPAR